MEVMVHGHSFFRSMSDDGRWGVGLVGGKNPWASPGHQKMVVNSFDVLAIFQWSHLGYTQQQAAMASKSSTDVSGEDMQASKR